MTRWDISCAEGLMGGALLGITWGRQTQHTDKNSMGSERGGWNTCGRVRQLGDTSIMISWDRVVMSFVTLFNLYILSYSTTRSWTESWQTSVLLSTGVWMFCSDPALHKESSLPSLPSSAEPLYNVLLDIYVLHFRLCPRISWLLHRSSEISCALVTCDNKSLIRHKYASSSLTSLEVIWWGGHLRTHCTSWVAQKLISVDYQSLMGPESWH